MPLKSSIYVDSFSFQVFNAKLGILGSEDMALELAIRMLLQVLWVPWVIWTKSICGLAIGLQRATSIILEWWCWNCNRPTVFVHGAARGASEFDRRGMSPSRNRELKKGVLEKILDPRLQHNYPIEGAFECVELPLFSVLNWSIS